MKFEEENSGDTLKKSVSSLMRKNFVMQASFVYITLALISLTAIRYGQKNLETIFSFDVFKNVGSTTILKQVALAVAFLILLSQAFQLWSKSYRVTVQYFSRVFGSMNLLTLLYLAILSSVAEEMLFRGVLQPYLGVILTSLIFGLMHMGPGGLGIWSLWALIAGLVLGLLFDAHQNLIPVIIIHFIVNFSSFVMIYYKNLRRFKDAAQLQNGVEVPPHFPK
ncbi:MAG: CPBP family intramembrane metalloprotease [Oligoflexales bacterium]|nr:CPBP family intramembrane metalloprotease [Oligoflexales bacterium]